MKVRVTMKVEYLIEGKWELCVESEGTGPHDHYPKVLSDTFNDVLLTSFEQTDNETEYQELDEIWNRVQKITWPRYNSN